MANDATLRRDNTILSRRLVDRVFLQSHVPGLQSPGSSGP